MAELPELVDCAKLMRELGVSRAAAEKIMRQVPKVTPPGLRKVYVRRSDVRQLLDDVTRAP
ncbi:MAG: hypothetical protein HY323_05305 [Betaproteobacteria bacterium]|nr:hypothetical protein [Betaproteobacteria bacterium]